MNERLADEIIRYLGDMGVTGSKVRGAETHGETKEPGLDVGTRDVLGVNYVFGSIGGRVLVIKLGADGNTDLIKRTNEMGGIAFIASSVSQVSNRLASVFTQDLNLTRYWQ